MPSYPEPQMLVCTDIVLERGYLTTMAEQFGGPRETLTFRTVLDMATSIMRMQVLEDGRVVAERDVYQGVTQAETEVQGERPVAG